MGHAVVQEVIVFVKDLILHVCAIDPRTSAERERKRRRRGSFAEGTEIPRSIYLDRIERRKRESYVKAKDKSAEGASLLLKPQVSQSTHLLR